MSYHINAEQGEIADVVLLPGDPLRAKYIAEKFLEKSGCYNEVRNMLGFTGTYKGKKVSVQGTGMGIPSCSIYVTELIREYNVKTLIRVGSCGGIQKDLSPRTVILPISASTDSNINVIRLAGLTLAPHPNEQLLFKAYSILKHKGIKFKSGGVVSSDIFYDDDAMWKMWAEYGLLAVEMEANEIFTLAMKYGVSALSLLTVSNNLVTGDVLSSPEIEGSFDDMIETALEVAMD